jgi:hypothetical protein
MHASPGVDYLILLHFLSVILLSATISVLPPLALLLADGH